MKLKQQCKSEAKRNKMKKMNQEAFTNKTDKKERKNNTKRWLFDKSNKMNFSNQTQ